jgi:hypothetical protein
MIEKVRSTAMVLFLLVRGIFKFGRVYSGAAGRLQGGLFFATRGWQAWRTRHLRREA